MPRPGRTLSVQPPVDPAMRKRLSDYSARARLAGAERFDVNEAAVAAATGAEIVFEEVACRS